MSFETFREGRQCGQGREYSLTQTIKNNKSDIRSHVLKSQGVGGANKC